MGYKFKPFYVGKGCERRAIRHLEESKRNVDNLRKYYKIQKIREEGLEPVIEYHSTDLIEDDAYGIETDVIKEYGRKDVDDDGILTNLLLDGRPPVRRGPMSQAQKDAIAAGNRGKKRTKEQSEYLSSIRKGKTREPLSEQTKEKIRLGNIAAKADKKLSECFVGRTFGSWVVIEKARDLRPKIRGANGIFWQCQCSCGFEKQIQQTQLAKNTFDACACAG